MNNKEDCFNAHFTIITKNVNDHRKAEKNENYRNEILYEIR